MSSRVINVIGTEFTSCPVCGDENTTAWAEDGEADLADFWECPSCGSHGAIVTKDNPSVTPNGVDATVDAETTVFFNVGLLRQQRNWLLTMPDTAENQGLVTMLDDMLDNAEGLA